MVSTHVILLAIALICFLGSTFNISVSRINLISLGLVFFVLAALLGDL